MERISRKTRKRRISSSVIIIIIIIITFSVFFVIINKTNYEVLINNITFQDDYDNIYVNYDIINTVNYSKICLIKLSILNKTYQNNLNLSPFEKIKYKILVDMPGGKTDISIKYICS